MIQIYRYTMECYSSIKKKEIMPLEIITLSEVSQKEKDKCHMVSFTHET